MTSTNLIGIEIVSVIVRGTFFKVIIYPNSLLHILLQIYKISGLLHAKGMVSVS